MPRLPDSSSRPAVPRSLRAALAVGMLALPLIAGAASSAAAAEEAPPVPEPERLSLRTTDADRVDLTAWFYAAAGEENPLATVLLVHDLGGDHTTLEDLAVALQRGGCAVVVPDLRGHGESRIARLTESAGGREQSDLLKRNDFMAMAATAGGRLRKQAAVRGDLECVRNWLKERADGGDLDTLYVVGSGLGAAVATTWTLADAAWPPVASGRQGGDVQGVVLIEPALVTRGFSMSRLLNLEPIRSELPVMILSAAGSRDATRVFEQFKRSRPNDWFDSREGTDSAARDTEATVIYLSLPARAAGGRPLSADQFASLQSPDPRRPDPATLILTFIRATLAR